ncbi:hypothetical protein D3C87_1590250 [compost metagenome]
MGDKKFERVVNQFGIELIHGFLGGNPLKCEPCTGIERDISRKWKTNGLIFTNLPFREWVGIYHNSIGYRYHNALFRQVRRDAAGRFQGFDRKGFCF